MLFQTTAQFIALALVLLAGWLFGLASAPGGRRAKERLREAEAAHTANRVDLERRLAAAEARASEAERERDRLSRSAPVTAAPATAAAVGTPVAASAGAAHASSASTSNSLFGSSRDDLSKIRGIDGGIEARMHDEGIHSYRQVEDLSAQDEAELERRLGLAAGTIGEQRWREQAAMLRDGRTTIRPGSSL